MSGGRSTTPAFDVNRDRVDLPLKPRDKLREK
jgi:hypothetical protein